MVEEQISSLQLATMLRYQKGVRAPALEAATA